MISKNKIVVTKASGLTEPCSIKKMRNSLERSKAFGIGGDICLKAGYCLTLKNNYFLSPFISIGYIPYLYSPNSEAVINQTKELTSKNWTGILTTQIGLTFHLKRQQND
jgi:hypothetical protein